jgi:hypothetical protein
MQTRNFKEKFMRRSKPIVTNAYQGCQIFISPKYQSGEKLTKLPQNIPNGHKIFPMAVK